MRKFFLPAAFGLAMFTSAQAAEMIPPTTEPAKIAQIAAGVVELALPAGYSYRVGMSMPGSGPTFTVATSTGHTIIFTRMAAATAPRGDIDQVVTRLLPAYQTKDGFLGESTGHDTVGGAAMTYVQGANSKSRGEKAIHAAVRTPAGAVVTIDSNATLDVTKKLLAAIKGWR